MEWSNVDWGDAAAWGSSLIALLALVVAGVTARAQYRLGVAQRDLAEKQYQLGVTQRELTERLAVAHAGAQTAMMWRDQVFMLHDRGLDPDEIRWIMCCEHYGVGHEEMNGIIDEVVGNVPRVPPDGMQHASSRSDARRLQRPDGHMRADLLQEYEFKIMHTKVEMKANEEA